MDIQVSLYRVGAESVEPITVKDATFSKLRDIVECRNAELVSLMNNNYMLVDEEGLLESKELNELASNLVGGIIVGDAMIVSQADLDAIPYK